MTVFIWRKYETNCWPTCYFICVNTSSPSPQPYLVLSKTWPRWQVVTGTIGLCRLPHFPVSPHPGWCFHGCVHGRVASTASLPCTPAATAGLAKLQREAKLPYPQLPRRPIVRHDSALLGLPGGVTAVTVHNSLSPTPSQGPVKPYFH